MGHPRLFQQKPVYPSLDLSESYQDRSARCINHGQLFAPSVGALKVEYRPRMCKQSHCKVLLASSIYNPTILLDPTLAGCPVPQDRTFATRSVGPGAAAEIKTTAQTFKELYAVENPTAGNSNPEEVPRDEISLLLNLIEKSQQ